ncbi:MAG: sulfolactate dehydrogenase [Candidatus Aenigmarchaeota archaeon]|nr:sulfolactate dehydrogenase [Candidatus Aenigmarchaeota archaeon]
MIPSEIKKKIIKILKSLGTTDSDANITAEVLLEGDLRGYINHGINRLPQILEGVKNKTIDLRVKPELIKNHGGIATINGNYGLGYPIGSMAMKLAVEKSIKYGIGAVGVINCSHLGIMGYYSEIASKRGFIGISMTTSSPALVLNGGKIKTLGTNPISYSIPYKEFPITVDFSTAKIPRGLVYQYLNENKELPDGCAVDKIGNPTTDPKKALEGGLLPFGNGDMKGLFLNMLISILCGSTIGGVINPKVTGTRNMTEKPNKGDFFIAINVNKTTNKEDFDKKNIELFKFIKDQNIKFRIPNERSYKTRMKNLKNGIEVPEKTKKIFEEYGLWE